MAKIYNLVCDGNSLTSGTQASNADTTAYPPVLRDLLIASQATHADKYWSVKSVGVSGHSTPQRTAAFATAVQPHFSTSFARNVVAFFEVSNDIITNASSVATAIANVQAYVTQARLNGWQVMLSTVTPTTVTANNANTRIPEFNTWLRANPTWSDFPIVDLAANASLDDPTDTNFYFSDGLHCIDAGYAAMAGVFHTSVAAIQDTSGPTPLTLLKRLVYDYDQLELSNESAWETAVAAIATEDYRRMFSLGSNMDRQMYRYRVYGFDSTRLALVYNELLEALTA